MGYGEKTVGVAALGEAWLKSKIRRSKEGNGSLFEKEIRDDLR